MIRYEKYLEKARRLAEKLKEKIEILKAQEKDAKLNLGCLPMIIQLVVFIGLFGVIYTPLTNVLRIDDNTVNEMKVVMAEAIEDNKDGDNMLEITLLKETENYNFILIIEDPDEINKLNLTIESLRNYFSLIYE